MLALPPLVRAALLSALSFGHLLSGLRSIATTRKDDGVPLILELLSARACPAGALLLLHMAAASSLAVSGATLALARTAAFDAPLGLAGGLAARAEGLVPHGTPAVGGDLRGLGRIRVGPGQQHAGGGDGDQCGGDGKDADQGEEACFAAFSGL